ncbi:uncharacterized protein N7473_013183 [Penicillium subrubescens]|uniref:uncharacterized protein n=1 Tax=Penicillium subrubescens TaxID=1316194 RepID=UPI002545B994|nr:uncharacterized protein N7473_013183 [Penicillium subrubescens]KAJ5873624.1 hypothetical protein N7473_013183 [Penicillium subrubescens]
MDIERKKCLDRQIVRERFNSYQETIAQYGISADDIWNFDETGFNIGVVQDLWFITREPKRQIFDGFSTNREYATAIEAVSATRSPIAPVAILRSKVLLLQCEWVYDATVSGYEKITNDDFLGAIAQIRQKTFKPSTIKLGFRLAGLWPTNPTIVLENLVDEVDEVDLGFHTPNPPSTIAAGG